MKKISLILSLLLPAMLLAQKGDVFPSITGIDLNEKSVEIPTDTKGKFTLVGVAFSEKAQEDLYSWSQPVFNYFLDENNLNSMVYDPNVHLVLLFTGLKQAVFEKAKKQILEGTDESLKDNILLYKGKMLDYRSLLKMEDPKQAYFYVLDKEGKIIYTHEGRYNKKALEEVATLIEK